MALLPVELARDWLVSLHLLLGAVGVAVFANRIGSRAIGAALAGSIFATCGYVASMPANNNAQLLCWVPWIAWAAEPASTAPAPAANRG